MLLSYFHLDDAFILTVSTV